MVDLIFAKPLDETLLTNLAQKTKIWFVFSPSAKIGGVGSLITSFLQRANLNHIRLVSFEYEDKFIEHGNTDEVEKSLNLSVKAITKKILQCANG